jgi:uncharacterized protein (TIGR03663 family)
VATASTKWANRKTYAEPAELATETDVSESTWTIACIAILAVAALLRFYDLDLVPLHHDEGVNGNFLVRLVREGMYRYDPANYHGPTLYYFAAIYPRLIRTLFGAEAQDKYGLTTTAIRAVTASFGLATIALVFALRRKLGTIATLFAAALLAISPGAVYLSRYFIHETLFVFFTLALVVTALKYFEETRSGYLVLASVSAALLFATKETAVISVIVLGLALLLTQIYRAWWKPPTTSPAKKKNRKQLEPGFVERAGGNRTVAIWAAIALAVFVAVNVIFYSSLFTNYPKGVWDALRTFEFWRKTGKEAHVHPLTTYAWWLLLQESPLLVLGAIGAMLAVVKPRKLFALFSALWAFGLIAAYSLISYKTPWLCLSFIVPLALVAGHTFEWLYWELEESNVGKSVRIATLAGLFILATGPLPGIVRARTQDKLDAKTFIPGYQTLDLNFRNYDNDDRYYVYVYAHTRRETLNLVDEINRIAERTHQGDQTGITIVSPDYWPLPWYLRDYDRVGYYGRMVASNEPVIIASQSQVDEIKKTFGDRYQQVHSGFNLAGSFPLRPGVDLLLYTRRELVR